MRVQRLLRSLPLAGLLVAVTAAPASAHFVWVEPAPGMADRPRVCFGEYPRLREGGELLGRIARTQLRAVGAGDSRPLSHTPGPDHLLAAAAGGAPVVAAVLDYGVLQRGDTPPYFLRYEAIWLRGAGGALGISEAGRLSELDPGTRLAARIQPGEDGLRVRITHRGSPAAGQVTCVPAAGEPVVREAGPDGWVTLPAPGSGPQHFRIRVDDGKPVTHEGKSAAFTRTYLSVHFELAGAAPAPDAEAVRVLDEAHRARANWKADFPGFTAEAVLQINGRTTKGKITVGPDFAIRYELGDPELQKAVHPSFASLIMHRRGSGAPPRYAATWRDSEAHPLGRAINLNDDLGSYYRVRDRQILQVNRRMGSQRFTNNVLENEETRLGFLPRVWTVAYYDNETNRLLRVSTTRVTWTWQGDVFLPASLETSNSHGEGTDYSSLTLTHHRLLGR